jgi:hypothetical protein
MKNETDLRLALLGLGLQTQRTGPNTFAAGIKTRLYRDHEQEPHLLISLHTSDDSDALTIRAPFLVKLTGRPFSAQNAAILTASRIAAQGHVGRLDVIEVADTAFIGFQHHLLEWDLPQIAFVLAAITVVAELRCEEIQRALLTDQVRVSSPEEVAEGYARLVSELEDEGIRL